MTLHELDFALDRSNREFLENVRLEYPEDSDLQVTYNDIREIAKQAFYAMDGMRDQILKYLQQAK